MNKIIKTKSIGFGIAQVEEDFILSEEPMSHDPVKDLRDSGLYTEQDCLNALGLLSHLFRRLDNSKPS